MFFRRISLRRSRPSVGGSETSNDNLHFDKPAQTNSGLSPLQTVLATVLLLSWLFLFAGGITMDTIQYRCAISAGGARALAMEARPGDDEAKTICKQYERWVPLWHSSFSAETAKAYRIAAAWLGLLLFFLPLNLAMVSSAAGAVGAVGNKANLEDDPMESNLNGAKPAPSLNGNQEQTKSQDNSSPIMSGLLRGLFVYLFFISGLLLFDDKPFSSPGPGQYIRLAGFISLISFLVNYRPHLFATISDWAFDRINSRKVVPTPRQEKTEITLEEAELDKKKSLPVASAKPAINGDGEEIKATPIDKSFIQKSSSKGAK